MEAGFKKLWSRKKSWGSTDQPFRSRRLSSSNGVNGQSQLTGSNAKEGRPSMASSHYQSEQSYGRERSSGSRDLLSGTPNDEFGRTKSGHRIQPMLVGISRPDTGNLRPDTAGSLQTAVQQAADSIEGRPSNVSTRPVTAKSSQITKIPSRHVDIFAMAASMPSYMSRYNEEIAERNLDTYRLVLENTPYVYDPSSKFQEEVAVRNAYLPYRSRNSGDQLQRPFDYYDRSVSVATRSIRSVASPQPNGGHSYQLSTDSAGSGQRPLREQTNQHSRHISQRSYDSTQLNTGPHELDYGGRDEVNIVPHAPYSPSRVNGASRDARMQTIAEGRPYELRQSNSTTSGNQRDSGQSSYNASTDYKLSAADFESRPTTNRSNISDRSFELSYMNSLSVHQPTRSIASSSSRMVILPNRTVMDLTDDVEPFSETSSQYNYSPVIEQAKSDAFRRVMPSQIRTEERRGSRGADSFLETPTKTPIAPRIAKSGVTQMPAPEFDIATSSDRRPEPVLEQIPESEVTTPRALEQDTAKILEIKTEPPQPDLEVEEFEKQPLALSSSSFSPISTVASWSPRSSAYINSPSEPMSMTARVAAALEASKAITKENPVPLPSKIGNEAPSVKERVATYENSAERGISPPLSIRETGSTGVKPRVPSAMEMMGYPALQSTKIEAATIPVTDASAKIRASPTMHTSPESITSVDFINPSSSFGVRTRDFAVTPRKSDITLKKTAIKKAAASSSSSTQPIKKSTKPVSKSDSVEARAKTPKSRPKENIPTNNKSKDTGFDEEAFARKQADARAALDRLQRSLSEDFMTLPDRNTVRNSKGKSPEVQTAPVLVLPPEQKTTSTAPPQRAETDRPPPSSFRNSRGSIEKEPLGSNSRSLSAGSRSSRRAPAPSSLKNVEPATNPIDHNMLSPALLQAIQHSSKPPKSPGEISLSSFPVPSSSRPPSQPDVPTGYHSHTNSFVGIMKRRNSAKSQGSTASTFSIPYHMVPGRTSSVRDPLPEEADMIWA